MRLKHSGRHAYRFRDNPEEARLAEAWDDVNERGDILAWLLDRRPIQTGRPVLPTDAEITTAATVIQWLGSPVGQAWLRELGYERVAEGTGT